MKSARPLRAIRLKCYDCSGWQWPEVANCTHTDCALYALRFGKRPKGLKYTHITPKEYASIVESGTAVGV